MSILGPTSLITTVLLSIKGQKLRKRDYRGEEIYSMEKSQRRRLQINKFQPILDVDEFNKLTDLLFELMKENHSQCAQLCGVNRKTWKTWETKPPTWPWWNMVLRHIIKMVLSSIIAKRGLTKKHKHSIQQRLNLIPDNSDFVEELGALAYSFTGAEAHLRRLLRKGGMYWDDIRLAANCGGYSPKTLRVAARALGIVKSQHGYGNHKRAYWKLPDQDDE